MRPRPPTDKFFRDLEERLMQPAIRRSPDEMSRLLASDFLEFGRSGRTYDRTAIIRSLSEAGESDGSPTVSDFVTRALAEDVVLVTYRTVRHDAAAGEEIHSLRSSIWKRTDGRWQMAFHQGTPTRPRGR
jgi:hypothetical protein